MKIEKVQETIVVFKLIWEILLEEMYGVKHASLDDLKQRLKAECKRQTKLD